MRTTVNFQYRYGMTTIEALKHLYAEGGVAFAERTAEAVEQVRPARLVPASPTNPNFPGEIQPAKRVWESDAFGSKTHL